jgi:hypothetical protein
MTGKEERLRGPILVMHQKCWFLLSHSSGNTVMRR